MAEKIVQPAGRDALGEFAPEFAHYNDDVLFGENWNNTDIDLKTRSIITVVALAGSLLSVPKRRQPRPQRSPSCRFLFIEFLSGLFSTGDLGIDSLNSSLRVWRRSFFCPRQ